MTRKAIVSIGILVVLLVSLIGTAAAADVIVTDTATATETTQPTPLPGSKFFTHPVVKLLSAYFDEDSFTPPPTETATETVTDTVESSETVTVTDTVEPTATPPASGLGPVGELIAMYHEQGMGFGVLVKIFSYVESSEDACAAKLAVTPGTETTTAEPCVPLTAEELITKFNEEGMGALFKEYGKPALLGVGHVRHPDKHIEPTTTETTVAPEIGVQGRSNPGRGNKPETARTPSPKGKGKGPNK